MVAYVLVGISKPGTHELQPGINRVGRNPTNEIRISDVSVSSFHGEIAVAADGVIVRDLCSTNGTFVDGSPINELALAPGQVIRFGAAEFRFERVEISIPKIEIQRDPEPSQLADGSPACLHHPKEAAHYACEHCHMTWCEACVHTLGLSGSVPKVFCPRCSGQCRSLRSADLQKSVVPGREDKVSILGRLSQTIRLRRR